MFTLEFLKETGIELNKIAGNVFAAKSIICYLKIPEKEKKELLRVLGNIDDSVTNIIQTRRAFFAKEEQ